VSIIFDLQKVVQFYYKETGALPVEIHINEKLYSEILKDNIAKQNIVIPKGHNGNMYLMGMVLVVNSEQEVPVTLYGIDLEKEEVN